MKKAVQPTNRRAMTTWTMIIRLSTSLPCSEAREGRLRMFLAVCSMKRLVGGLGSGLRARGQRRQGLSIPFHRLAGTDAVPQQTAFARVRIIHQRPRREAKRQQNGRQDEHDVEGFQRHGVYLARVCGTCLDAGNSVFSGTSVRAWMNRYIIAARKNAVTSSVE